MRFPFSSPEKPKGDFKPASNRMWLVIGIVASVLILATVTAAMFRSKRAIPVVKAVVAPGSQQTPAVQSANRAVEALPIQLKRGGFVPRAITRPAGDYIFSVSNQSGVTEIHLRLEREHGVRVHEARVERERLRWRQRVSLTPGTYLITEASHPAWVCRIVIMEQ